MVTSQDDTFMPLNLSQRFFSIRLFDCLFFCDRNLKLFLYLARQFNFVGKLLGPKGNSLKRLQEETLTKMAILGRGSMRDKHKVTYNNNNNIYKQLSL